MTYATDWHCVLHTLHHATPLLLLDGHQRLAHVDVFGFHRDLLVPREEEDPEETKEGP